jgi:hypothetical protein
MTMNDTKLKDFLNITKRLRATATELANVVVCSDFSDHNYLHTFDRMRRTWLRLADSIRPANMKPIKKMKWSELGYADMVAESCRWAAAALSDVSCRMPSEDYRKLVQGMWTGWRSTSFLNTIYNLAYQRCTQASYENMYGQKSMQWHHLLGDDMYGSIRSELEGLRYLEIIDYSGLDATSIKQMLDADRGEYLRLMYEDGQIVKGSLARAIGGVVSSDTQAGEIKSGPDTAYAINESIHTLIRRCLGRENNIEQWRYVVVKYWADAVYFERKNRIIVKPSHALLTAPLYIGGIGCMRYGDDMKAWSNRDKYEAINFKGFSYKKLIEQLPHYASDAAANIFIKKLYRHGMKLKNKEVFVGAHATPLFESAMPDSVQKAARRMYGQSVAEWYKANKTMKLKKVPLVKLITQVEHLFMGRPEAWMTLDSNPIENLELARANSLKEAGVASGALDMIDRGGRVGCKP